MQRLRCLFAAWIAIAGVASAQSLNTEMDFSVRPQPLATAIIEFSKQSEVQILASGEKLNGVSSPGVSGRMSVERALSALLAGTGFSFRDAGRGTVTLIRTEEADRRGEARGVHKAESIVVTAQKRDERALDVPISIVAMGSRELELRKITSLDDLGLAVPGLAIQGSGSYQRRINLRGISNTFGSNSSTVGLYLDEVPVTSRSFQQLDLRTFDLERVEVLRGPQGTLYGEGSMGGTIRFITKNPQLDRFAMNADVAALFTEGGAPGQRIESMVNVPLAQDEMAIRMVGTFDHQGGWIDQPAADRRDFNDQNLWNVRIKGLWQPSPQLQVHAMAVVHRNDTSPNKSEDENGNYTQVFNQTTTPRVLDKYHLYNLTLTYDFLPFQFLSATSYIQQDKESRNLGFRFQFTPPGTPLLQSYPTHFTDNTMFSQEVRLASLGSGPWQWTVGAFYRDAKLNFSNFSRVGFEGGALPAVPRHVMLNSASESWAAFGDTTFRLTDHLTLGGGIRYFEDKQESATGNALVPTPVNLVVQSGKFDSINPRVYAQYKVGNNVNAYLSAAKGFRSGGFNALNQPRFGPEEVWTYELGTKMSLLSGRLGIDTAAFYSEYSDVQIVGFPILDPTASVTSNVGDAQVKGVELAVAYRPSDRWTLSFNGYYADSRFQKIRATVTSHLVGDVLDLFPRYGLTVSAQHDFRWNTKPGFVRIDYNKQGPSTYRNRSTGPWYYSESDVIDMLNVNVGLQWSQALSIGFFAQNLLNDRGFVDAIVIEDNAARARPRTFGVGFTVNF
jgi:iron complex outermembrane recepter protein